MLTDNALRPILPHTVESLLCMGGYSGVNYV